MSPKVIVISLDGATDSIVDRSGVLDTKTGLGLLKSKGVAATDNETITPSLTAPSHIAITTGSTAVNNNINANSFHLLSNPFTTNTSGFAAPIGGYTYQSSIDPAESANPTANPLWLSLQAAGKKVVAATFPGADGATIRSSTGIVLDKKEDRTVSYTVPFGEFGGQGARGFSLTATDFGAAAQSTLDQLQAIGKTSFSPVLQTKTVIESFTIGGVKFDFQVAALDTTNDSKVNYDSIVVFDAAQGIKAAPATLPSTGSAFLKAGDTTSQPFYLEGTPNKVGTGFFVANLASDLSTVRIARYGTNSIPRPANNPGVVANVDDINNNVGFWKPQPDFRIPERISPGLRPFTDLELEAIYADQVQSFVDYQTNVAIRAISQNNNADLVLTYIEQPDGAQHQFLITDPRQATDFTNPNSIGAGQDTAKIARYQRYIENSYQTANRAVQKIIDTVGVDANGKPNSNIIVVSDHGFAPFHTAVSMNNLLRNAGFDSNKVRAVTSGAAVNVYINLKGREPNGVVEVAEYLTLQKQVLDTLRCFADTNANYVTGAASNPIFDKVYNRTVPATATTANDVINARGEFIGADTGDVFALLKTGYNFDGAQATPVIRQGEATSTSPVLSVPNFYGAHGYDPTLPEMKAIFYAAGPKLADGRQSIVLVSDNNFGATQFTQVIALSADVIPTATPLLETTPALVNDSTKPFSQRADADDPAIYVNATDAAKSLVFTSVKNGGLRIYDLQGNLLQTINPSNPGIRYNNIDLQYGFTLGGQKIDIAVASDRNNDKLAIFKVNPNSTTGNYLENITDSSAATIFQGAPFSAPFSASATSAYGLALYRSPFTNDYYAFATRRQTGDIAQLKLVDKGNGKVGYDLVRNFTVPSSTTAGATPQTEGIVADQETGFLYIGQEDVGIWKYKAEPNGGSTGTLIEKVKAEGGKNLTNDVEGLTIYYGKDGTGYLLASSQGDSTFGAYTREGNNSFIGRFGVSNNGAIDSVQESDGADVINLPLGPNFPKGLFVTQDGRNDPATIVNNENVSTNFKFVPFENIANAFAEPLKIDTTSYDPRNPVARPQAIAQVTLPNGVASGDTTQNSTVLWTRATTVGKVTFEYSTKADFSVIAGTKTATVTDPTQPVKVSVDGLTANTDYFYRVTDANNTRLTGKFSTAAALGNRTGLKFGVSGDWRGELSPYPAIANADTANLKFFVELGDTIYGDVASPVLKNPDGTEKKQATTVADYRAKYSEVYGNRFGQNTWADLRANTSVFATPDDHEVTNDFAGGQDLANSSAADQALYGAKTGLINDSPLFENGLKVFQEYHPINDLTYSTPGDARTDGERKIYRANTFGSDAVNIVLDARSFRDQELAGVTNLADQAQVGKFLADSFNPARTMLGKQQVADLKRDLLQAQKDGITWKFINIPEPIQNIGVSAASDRFEGYAAERTEILKFINDNKISNVVFVAADIHGTLVNNLTYQTAPGQPQIATSAFEISTGSVAYSQPFGPTIAQLGATLGVLTAAQKAAYDAGTPAVRDAIIKGIVDGGLQSLGYDPLGLDKNLTRANGLINAKLLQGDYVATNTYGWTEFNIDQKTQKLTVTTYGIDAYTRAELEANPTEVANRQPKIVSQFEVLPAAADLELTQVLDNSAPSVGDQLVFTLTVSNKGAILADGIKVNDLLPKELSFVSATAGQGTYDSKTGLWDVGAVDVNGSNTLKIIAKVDSNGLLTNKAEIIAQKQADIDSTPGNNSATEDDQTSLSFNPTALVSGTTGADKIDAGITPGFDGKNDVVFTGAGNDNVDVAIAGSAAGNNRIDTGSGNDLIFVADADRVFGSTGNDEFEAGDAKDYRAAGGAGDDTFYLGTNGRALGGEGNDKFFVGTAGGNLLTGGAGVDQFWIANGDLPAAANTILDFQVGIDVVGIRGIGANATNIVLTQLGADTSIGFSGQTLALLKNIQASSSTPSNSGQFVFA